MLAEEIGEFQKLSGISGKTGKFAIDSLNWAYAKTPKESKPAEEVKAAALKRAMQATASRPTPESMQAATPAKAVKPVTASGLRPVPKRSRRRDTAIVMAVLFAGGLILAAAGILLLLLLR